MNEQKQVYNVLVLCTGNSARSVMAEGLINVMGRGRFKAFSAGSKPSGRVNPFAIEQLETIGHDTSGLRSKSWDEFSPSVNPDAPQMDFVITVCDNAAGETCPLWYGAPVSAHWGFPDPGMSGTDEEKRADFAKVFRMIMARVHAFVNLPMHVLDANALRSEVKAIADVTGLADAALQNEWIQS
jgi:arsenate reductase (thioredoxin)